MEFKKIHLWLLSLSLIILLLGCKNPKDKKAKEPLPQKTASVEKGEIYLEVSATGAVKPQVGAQVKVGARISGRVESLFVRQGDFVKNKQLIAIIEHKDLKNQVERYEFDYKQALSQLEKIKMVYPEKIRSQQKTIQALQRELNQLERDYQRFLNLHKEGLISKTELERLDKDREVKLNQLEAEKYQLRALEAEFEKELERAKAQLEASKRQLEEARVRLNYAFVYSPINGYVSEVTTQQGETVVAGLNAPTFITVIDLSRLEIHCYIDETDIGKIKPGMEAYFRVDSFPDKIFKARVRTIYPGAIIKNNVVFYDTVLDILTPYENYLRPEMTAQVTIIAGKKDDVILVPSGAVKIDPQGKSYVMVKIGEKWEKRFVKTGWESRGKIEVLEGLSQGETVGVW
ncbi:MAG: efflux RND transporter periplasmic adaptor subunit [Caldimicrobium sp.]|nr:efflux RND transporter periplasmic adaptor subunit [Caldimicrobium sp.]MCX7614093.1 efflux RND transporter periplasmic adaptor subunit [Caldimicrobium sp.]MDW8182828.1 efflux RND transporter periplasmic adaptor subunit [Caldimicrobium sp.]